MHYVFLDKLPLPIAPGAISFNYGGKNKTVELISGEDITIIKKQGLTEVSFSFLIPHMKYPFASYDTLGFVGVNAILSYLAELKKAEKPFQFIVSRMKGGRLLQATNLKVTLEEYSIEESADNGLDQMCSVTLRQYVPYSTKVLTVDENGNTAVTKTRG
ncbi:MAG: hypothetical protein IJN28_05945 [Selenomonadales bacterium]|nr:hypothetical protein [Selenomonadales bacterium]